MDLSKLTVKQRRVFDLFVQGIPAKAIAHKLYVGDSCIHTHMENIRTVMGINNNTQLLVAYYQWQLRERDNELQSLRLSVRQASRADGNGRSRSQLGTSGQAGVRGNTTARS